LEKLTAVLEKTRINFFRMAWVRFRRYGKYMKNCSNARMFLKITTGRQVGRVLVKCLHRSFIRMFEEWKLKARWGRELEEHAAVLEMQATVRMRAGQKVTQIKREYKAATDVARVQRGRNGRQVAAARKIYLQMKWGASVIENAWINLSMIRIARKLVYEKKLNAAASCIQGLWRARCARVRMRLMKELRVRDKNALMLQALYRGFITRAIVYDENANVVKGRAAIKIQNIVRGFLAFLCVEEVREQWAAATCIQSMIRIGQARRMIVNITRGRAAIKVQAVARGMLRREKIARRNRWFAAQFDNKTRCIVKIQNCYRTKKAREKIALRKRIAAQREEESAMLMQKLQRGRITRMDLQKKRMFRQQAEQEKVEQIGASVILQGKFRQRAATKRVKGVRIRNEETEMNRRASKIQSIQRGRKGRRKTAMLKQQKSREEEERLLGKYFVMRREYLAQQETEHGSVVRVLQSGARKYLGRLMVKKMLKLKLADLEKAEQDHAASILQNKIRGRNAKKELKKRKNFRLEAEERRIAEEERERFEKEGEENGAARKMQCIQRGRKDRIKVAALREEKEKMKESIGVLQRCLRKYLGRRMVKRMLKVKASDLARAEQEHEENLGATRLQALFRGNRGREQNKERTKLLRAEKRKEEKEGLGRAATHVQCGWRKNRARRVFRAKKKVWNENEKLRLEDEELERNLESLHQEQEMLLYVMRLQNAYRVRKAKKAFSIVRIANMKMGETAKEKRKDTATLKLQSWARGMKGRAWLLANMARMREELEYRSWCVECMEQMATRRCTTCLDRYCENCWGVIHRAGRKRQHAWDVVETAEVEAGFEAGSSLGLKKGGKKGNASEWVEYFDDSAGSSYWYHVNTGEASWVKPF